MSTLFSRIVSGEIPAYRIAEDTHHLAFLDVNPLCKGHALVIPKKPVDYIFDLDDTELAALHLFAKKVATALKKAVPCTKVGMAVVGLEVPHAHIHLVPMNHVSDMNFSAARVHLSEEEFNNTAKEIASFF